MATKHNPSSGGQRAEARTTSNLGRASGIPHHAVVAETPAKQLFTEWSPTV